MAELKDMLQGVAEAKQRRFADEDFAGAHARVVTGRVKRRRAASSVGVGGASVLGAGALAVGVFNIPWGALGTAAPGSGAGTVVCTTATPAVTDWPPVIFTLTDPQDRSSVEIAVPVEGEPELLTAEASLRAEDDGSYLLTLPNGTQVSIDFTVAVIALFEGQDPRSSMGIAVNGAELEVTTETPEAELPQPVVTCVTTTPEPPDTLSPSESPTSDEPVPDVSITTTPGLRPSPFQCGYELPEEQFGSDQLKVTAEYWTGAQLSEWLADEDAPEGGWTSDDRIPVAISSGFDEPVGLSWDGSGSTGFDDPAQEAANAQFRPEGAASIMSSVNFVAVKDGVVVGQLREPGAGEPPLRWLGLNNGVAQGLTVAMLSSGLTDTMTACANADLGDDWDLYAVAGTTFLYPDGSWDPVDYAWAKFE